MASLSGCWFELIEACLKKTRFMSKWEMVLLLFTGVLVVYTLRVNISVAASDMRDELNWTEAQKGFVLSAFYWGYALGQIPSSRLVQIYGAKWIFGFSILIPSILTLLVPIACRDSFGLALFIRAIIGLCESASFPAVFHFFPIWVPLKEKTFMIPAIISGMYMGEIVGFSLSGSLVASDIYMNGYNYGQWPAVFYVFGFLGIVWFPFWAVYAYESPAHHPLISAEELALINEGKTISKLHEYEAANNTKPLLSFHSVNRESNHICLVESGLSPDEASTPPPVSSKSSKAQSKSKKSKTNQLPYSLLQEDDSFSNSNLQSADDVSSSPSEFHQTNPMSSSHNAIDSEVMFTASYRNSIDKSKGGAHGNTEYRTREVSLVSLDGEEQRLEMAHRTPWKAFFTHSVSLTLFINSWAFGWIGFTLLSEMPSFLTDELGFDISSAGIMCVFPYLALFLSTIFYGKLFNYLQHEHGLSTDSVRQLAEFFALLGASVGLLVCGFLENKYAAYSMLIVTQFMMGAIQTGLGCAYSDVAPNYSSSLNSVGNCVGALAGILGPIAVSLCLDSYPGIVGWRIAFFITAIFAAVALAFWSRFQTSDVVMKLNSPAQPDEKCCGQ